MKNKNEVPEFVNIDGVIIKFDTIVSVSKISMGTDIVFSFLCRPRSWYTFDISLNTGKTKTFSKSFSLRYFGNKAKDPREQKKAHHKITELRNTISVALSFREKALFKKQSEGRMERSGQTEPVVFTIVTKSDDPIEQILELFRPLNFHTQKEILNRLLEF